jgi:predicted DNA-binding transcriptional regulator YafY
MVRLAVRLLRLLTADGWTVYELADELGVSVRTTWRMLAAVRAVGLPLECQRRGPRTWYRLPRRWWE